MKRTLLTIMAVLTIVGNSIADNLKVTEVRTNANTTFDMNVELENETRYTAFQFDVTLPEGLTLKSVKGGDRFSENNPQIKFMDIGGGTYRIIYVATDGKALTGKDGLLTALNIAVAEGISGKLKVTLKNALFSDDQANGTELADVGATIIVYSPLVIKANDVAKNYGEKNPELTYTITGGEMFGEPDVYCEATEKTAIGTYDIIVGKGSVENPVTMEKGILTITKAPLTIKVIGEYTRKQGEENPEFKLEYEGFKNGETEEVLTKKPVITCTATKDSEPGEYEITVSGAEAQNYDITYVAGKLTVTKADPVVVTAKSYSREYGEKNPEFEFTSEGAALSGEPEITCEATENSPIGEYPIVIKKGSVTNYNDSYVNGTLTVTKASLTIKVVGEYTRKQGEENPEFKLEYEGFKNDETEEVLTKKPVIICTATKDSEPGEYEITVSEAEAQNYDITYIAGKLTVTKADPVVVTAKSYSREYGEKNPEFEFTSEGAALSGEPEITCEATEVSPVGDYPIIIKKGCVTNYNVSYVNGTLNITKALLTIKIIGEYTRKQGEENPEFKLEYEGFKNGETEEVLTKKPVITCTANKDSEPGEYDITVNGAEAQNYEITYVAGKLTVTEPEKPDNVFEEEGTSYEQLDDNTVAFSGDTNATGEYTIPETVTHEGMEYQVTEIAANAFKDNTDLTQVTIPGSVISIDENAFAGCTNLSMIVIYVTDPNISKVRTRATAGNAFEGVDKETCVLYVPAGSLEDYRHSEGWKDFKDIRPIGDANGDTIINAADIVEEVNCIMNNPSEKFIKAAADLNGDGVVNAADIVEMVNIIMAAK